MNRVDHGSQLPIELRRQMESFFGLGFSAVRLHLIPELAGSPIRALAGGGRIFFAPGQFRPNSKSDRKLIGHELAHLVQQFDMRADGAGLLMDPTLEIEAHDLGRLAAEHIPAPSPHLRGHVKRSSSKILQPALFLGKSLSEDIPGSLVKLVERANQRVSLKRTDESVKAVFFQAKPKVRQQGYVATDNDLRRVINYHVKSPGGRAGEKARLDSAWINTDFTFDSWDQLAKEFIYVLKSDVESNPSPRPHRSVVPRRSAIA